MKESILVRAWYIWWQRREFVKGEPVAVPSRTEFAIQALASNFGGALTKAEPHEITWTKPPRNMYKLNVDAACFHNGSGGAIAGTCWPLQNLLDATTAEATTLHDRRTWVCSCYY